MRIYILIGCLLPVLLFSGEFKAQVDRTRLNPGDTVTLQLTLKGASAKDKPEVSALKQLFVVLSQQQSSNTTVINGKVNAATSWKYVLLPQRQGPIQIPSISIPTNEGTVSSQPIAIEVSQGAAAGTAEAQSPQDMTLTVDVTNARPYKNEPFIYTIRLTSKQPVYNVRVPQPEIADAMVERAGDPQVYETKADGATLTVIEAHFVITPLKAGALKIPAGLIQGGLPVKRKSRLGSFFNDDFDPFSLIGGFEQLKPFGLSTEEILVQVKPSMPDLVPWLPARSVIIEDTLPHRSIAKVGEPVSRILKISAEGLRASQLPSLEHLQGKGENLKVYADKPELREEIREGKIYSTRKESYTLIPQQSGVLTLPEISLAWWNAAKAAKATAVVGEKFFDVSPAALEPDQPAPIREIRDSGTELPSPQVPEKEDRMLYRIIYTLAALLGLTVVALIVLYRKLAQAAAPKQRASKEMKSKAQAVTKRQQSKTAGEKLNDLNPT